jgi:hypothetical protein
MIMSVTIGITVPELKTIVRARRLGRYVPPYPLSYAGRPIAELQFDRNQIVSYYAHVGAEHGSRDHLASFQDVAYIDD